MTTGRVGAFAAAAALAAAITSAPSLALDVQGHRGARGLAPENTLAGFRTALAVGVTTLELDLGVTADAIPVVVHDRRLSPALTRDAQGRWLAQAGPAIHALPRAALDRYDVGRIDPRSRYAGRFPDQRPADGARIPDLAAVVDLVRDTEVRLNIEVKTHPEHPGETLAPGPFVDAVVTVIRGAGLEHRTTLQSFDWRALVHAQRVAPAIETAYLSAEQRWLDNLQRARPGGSPWSAGFSVDDHAGSVPRAVAAAGGAVWSPYHRELDAASLAEAHSLGLRVVVWTVNDRDDMARALDLGVDGIITDYPDRLRVEMRGRGLALPAPIAR